MKACKLRVEVLEGFITVWETTTPNQQITFGAYSASDPIDLSINWGDGNTESIASNAPTHIYTDPGRYTVIVTGAMNEFFQSANLKEVLQVSGITTNLDFSYAFDWDAGVEIINLVGDAVVTGLYRAFYTSGVSTRVTINLPNSTAADASNMFYMFTCPLVEIISLPSITNGYAMFRQSTIPSISVGGMPIINTFDHFFFVCTSLTSVTFTSSMPLVTSMDSMFYQVNNIGFISLDMSILSCPNLTTTANMFFDTNMAIVWMMDTTALDTVNFMFGGCTSRTSLDISALDTQTVTIFNSLFADCTSLSSVTLGDTSSGIDFSYVFDNCDLASIDVTNMVTSIAANIRSIFRNNLSLSADVSSWDVSGVTIATDAFKLTAISVTNYDALLASWSAQTVQPNVPMGYIPSKYTNQAARDILTSAPNNWTFTDDGAV